MSEHNAEGRQDGALNPQALRLEDIARILSASSPSPITVEIVQADIDDGTPVNLVLDSFSVFSIARWRSDRFGADVWPKRRVRGRKLENEPLMKPHGAPSCSTPSRLILRTKSDWPITRQSPVHIPQPPLESGHRTIRRPRVNAPRPRLSAPAFRVGRPVRATSCVWHDFSAFVSRSEVETFSSGGHFVQKGLLAAIVSVSLVRWPLRVMKGLPAPERFRMPRLGSVSGANPFRANGDKSGPLLGATKVVAIASDL